LGCPLQLFSVKETPSGSANFSLIGTLYCCLLTGEIYLYLFDSLPYFPCRLSSFIQQAIKIRNRKIKPYSDWYSNYSVITNDVGDTIAKSRDFKIPVFVYALVISTMLLFAFKGF
jgi:hypothetical protein